MGVVNRIGLGGDHVKPRDVDIGGEQAGEGCVLDRNSLTVQDKAADTAEDKHARQGGDERRNPHITDPVALPHTDSQAGQKAKDDRDIGVPAVVIDQHSRQTAGQADDRTNRQVDVTACQDAQQHTAGKNQHVAVLQQQVGHVLRQEQALVGEEVE